MTEAVREPTLVHRKSQMGEGGARVVVTGAPPQG